MEIEIDEQGFKDFVMLQPADRKINNDRTWCHCAVGDFIKEIKDDSEWFKEFDISPERFDQAARLGEMMTYLFPDLRNNAGDNPYKTYGDLQEAIRDAS